MSRENSKTKAGMGGAPDVEGGGEVALAEMPETVTAKFHAVPAWIKSQLEQLEVRRKARHLSERTSLSAVSQED